MNQRRADGFLVVITMIWGTTFALVRDVVVIYPVLLFLAMRFGVASLALLPLSMKRRGDLRASLGVGLILGILLFAGFVTQTLGLRYTTPSRAAFITGLCVVIVPFIGRAFGHRPSRQALLGVALACAGLLLLSFGCHFEIFGCAMRDSATPQRLLGDALVLACAIIFATHIVSVSHFSRRHPAVSMNTIQLAVVTILALVAAFLCERPLPWPSARISMAVVFLGLFPTALNFTAQIILQRHTSPTHAALIYSLEPVFATFFSWLWSGEQLTLAIWTGGALMMAGVIVAELPRAHPIEPIAGEAQDGIEA
ncbi:MAG: DMT family transporter [Vicinamibacteria bacterium]|jgi:drug/metabolite transporter (DMT)-like permease|nr:DMT family transporter [Vicinamibacteria bacterium]